MAYILFPGQQKLYIAIYLQIESYSPKQVQNAFFLLDKNIYYILSNNNIYNNSNIYYYIKRNKSATG